jgi:lipopolysaccharide export system permease protein
LFPDPNDKAYVERRGQFRAELFDRLMAPLYPIVFAVIVFAYLGPPRTNRQSRAISLAGAIGAVLLVRLIGFASTVFGLIHPAFLAIQYVIVAIAICAGVYVIRRGIILEAPAFITKGVTSLTERFTRRFATS